MKPWVDADLTTDFTDSHGWFFEFFIMGYPFLFESWRLERGGREVYFVLRSRDDAVLDAAELCESAHAADTGVARVLRHGFCEII